MWVLLLSKRREVRLLFTSLGVSCCAPVALLKDALEHYLRDVFLLRDLFLKSLSLGDDGWEKKRTPHAPLLSASRAPFGARPFFQTRARLSVGAQEARGATGCIHDPGVPSWLGKNSRVASKGSLFVNAPKPQSAAFPVRLSRAQPRCTTSSRGVPPSWNTCGRST